MGYPVQYPAAPPPPPVIPQVPSAQPVIPQIPSARPVMSQMPPTQPSYPSMASFGANNATPGRMQMQMPEAITMPVPEPPPPQRAPVIPPFPPPPVVSQPSQTPRTAPVTPGFSAVPPPPVFPTPGPRVIHTAFSSASSDDSPVIPPLPPGFVPRSGQAHPRAPHISSPRDERPRWSRLFPRPRSIQFHHNPLPQPPRPLPSPYVRLIDKLQEDPGEFLRRRAAERGGATTLILVPPVVPATTLPKGGASYNDYQEQKHRGGIFRSLSSAFGRKSKKRKEESSYRPMPYQPMVMAGQPAIITPAPPPPVIPMSTTPQRNVGPAGYTPAPGHASSVRMPAPDPAGGSAASPRAPSPRLASSRPVSPRAPSPRAMSPRPASPARSHHSHRTPTPRPRILVNLQNQLASLVHYSPHPVAYRGIMYPSAFHLLEALRFLDSRPDIAERISQCTSVPEVREIVHQASNFVRPDWEHVVISKVHQSPSLLSPLKIGRAHV